MLRDNEIQIVKGDERILSFSIYTDYHKTTAYDTSGKTGYLKVGTLFDISGATIGSDRNTLQFNLTNTYTNNQSGNYVYKIYLKDDSTSEIQTIVEDYFEILQTI